jgi:hypothetical protein
MVVAKSRLQKVPNVRKKLHNNPGTLSQNLYEAKIKVMKKARQAGRSFKAATISAAKKGKALARDVKMALTPRPTKYSVRAAAVENVRMLKAKHALAQLPKVVPPKARPSISAPSPASQRQSLAMMPPVTQKVVQGPSRPPPPPPSNIPSRPMMSQPKVAPKVPPKPMALRGNKMK